MFPSTCETFVKLKKVRNFLTKLNLLNTKYLYKRNDIYYFCVKIDNQVIKKSLFNNDYVYSNLLKYKIINLVKQKILNDKELNMFDNPFNKTYTIHKIGNSISLEAESEEEEKLLPEIADTIVNKIKRLRNAGFSVEILEDKKKDKLTIEKCFNQFYKLNEKKLQSDYLTKFRQVRDLLFMYFGKNKSIRDITPNEVVEFVDFLLSFPSNYIHIEELKDKDIKSLILRNSSILDKFPKVSPSTVDEHIKKCKTLFNFFLECNHIYTNPFLIIKKQATKRNTAGTNWLPFKEKDLKSLLKKVSLNEKFKEEYNLLKFCLYTGFRREELSLLKVENIELEKGFIDFDYEIDLTKTENSKRIVPIHKDIEKLILSQMENKEDNDYLFFNNKRWKIDTRGEGVGRVINKIILDFLNYDKETKKHYNLHSIRKNFIQTLVLSEEFPELDYKTIIGHSTSGDITDKHYLLGKRNYKEYKGKMDRVSFEEFFDQKILNKLKNDNLEMNLT